MKGQCRICHKLQELNRMSQVKSHKNKYTGRNCNGSFKPPVNRQVEQPLDYKEEELVCESGLAGCVVLYAGGVLTGVLFGYWLF